MKALMSYLADRLAMGVPSSVVQRELLDDRSLPGRAYSRALRVHCAASLRAQTQVRRRLGCPFVPKFVFFLARKDHTHWEQVRKQVVQAGSAREAREIAATHHGDEGPAVWKDSRRTDCTRLPDDGASWLVVQEYVS